MKKPIRLEYDNLMKRLNYVIKGLDANPEKLKEVVKKSSYFGFKIIPCKYLPEDIFIVRDNDGNEQIFYYINFGVEQ